jgi:hypothetical protein
VVDLAPVFRQFSVFRLESDMPKRITPGRTTLMDAPLVWTANRKCQKGKGKLDRQKTYSKPTLGSVEGFCERKARLEAATYSSGDSAKMVNPA